MLGIIYHLRIFLTKKLKLFLLFTNINIFEKIMNTTFDNFFKNNFFLFVTQNIRKYMKYENVFTEDYFDTKYVLYKYMKIMVHKSKEIYYF